MSDACDFCSQAVATRQYDTGEDIIIRAFIESGPEAMPASNFTRVWCACEKCAGYVDRGAIAELKEMVFGLWRTNPTFKDMMADPNGVKFARQMIDTVYDELATKTFTLIHSYGKPQA